MSIVLALFAVLCFICAIGILFYGLSTANEFEYEAKKMEKWSNEELERREAEQKGGKNEQI